MENLFLKIRNVSYTDLLKIIPLPVKTWMFNQRQLAERNPNDCLTLMLMLGLVLIEYNWGSFAINASNKKAIELVFNTENEEEFNRVMSYNLYASKMGILFDNSRSFVLDNERIKALLKPSDYWTHKYTQIQGLKKQSLDLLEKVYGFLTKRSNLLDQYKLIPNLESFDQNMKTSVTICISGFTSEGSDVKSEWRDFILPDDETEFYFYDWEAGTLSSTLKNTAYIMTKQVLFQQLGMGLLNMDSFNKVRAGDTSDFDILASENAFTWRERLSNLYGKLLAVILASALVFNQNINLVGFSLGTRVIKKCLIELYQLNAIDKVSNVVLLGGATYFGHGENPSSEEVKKWERIFEIVAKRKINCFSKNDQILNKLYATTKAKQPIGNFPINNWGFENFENTYGHLEYRANLNTIRQSLNLKLN